MFSLLQASLDQLRFEQAENIDTKFIDDMEIAMQSLDTEVRQNQ